MKAPTAKGAPQNNCGSQRQSTGTNLSIHSAGFSSKGGSPVKGARKVPCLNPDPFTCLIGPKNRGEAFIDDELTTQLNFMSPNYASEARPPNIHPRATRSVNWRRATSHSWHRWD